MSFPKITADQVEHQIPVGLPKSDAKDTDLGATFMHALQEARGLDTDARDQAVKFANNDPSVGIHEVVVAAEKANIAVRYAATLKNKALEAYKELMGTQV